MQARTKAGGPDQFGVTPLNVFAVPDGSGFCLTEAPSADAICQSHRALGFEQTVGNVMQVTPLA